MNMSHNYKLSQSDYIKKMSIHVGVSIAAGIVINDICKYIQIKYEINLIVMIILQICLVLGFIYVIEYHISNVFALEWQNITPGFVFIVFLFGLQFNLFDNLRLVTFVKKLI